MRAFLQKKFFGVGLHNGNAPSLSRSAGLICRDLSTDAYLEGHPDSKHLQELFPQNQQSIFAIQTVPDIKNALLGMRSPHQLAGEIIFLDKQDRADPKDRYSSRTQVVSSEFDFVHANKDGIIKFFQGPKEDVHTRAFITPFFAGSDRAPVHRVSTIDYDNDPSRQSTSTRGQGAAGVNKSGFIAPFYSGGHVPTYRASAIDYDNDPSRQSINTRTG